MLPVGAYVSWGGMRFEGNGIDPDENVDWSPTDAEMQLNRGLETVRTM
jgi:hypothetical protein